LAAAIGASIANPFVFEDVDVAHALKIDPGSDRVAATPVQDACAMFPDANMLVLNVQGTPAFHDARMTCPLREVVIDVADLPPEALFSEHPDFGTAWRQGHDATAAALARPPGA
jgi:hypothetical protein